MSGKTLHSAIVVSGRHIRLDMRDCYTCSFTEFYPFCCELFYYSSFKDFNAAATA